MVAPSATGTVWGSMPARTMYFTPSRSASSSSAREKLANAALAPSPIAALGAFQDNAGTLWLNFWPTFLEAALGSVAGNLVAIALAVWETRHLSRFEDHARETAR